MSKAPLPRNPWALSAGYISGVFASTLRVLQIGILYCCVGTLTIRELILDTFERTDVRTIRSTSAVTFSSRLFNFVTINEFLSLQFMRITPGDGLASLETLTVVLRRHFVGPRSATRGPLDPVVARSCERMFGTGAETCEPDRVLFVSDGEDIVRYDALHDL